MEKKELQDILKSKYSVENWKIVLKNIFGAKTLFENPYLRESLKFPNSEIADEAFELGKFSTQDGREIGVFEVKVKSNVILERNRVGLRNLLNSVYQNVDAALIVFDQGDKWRFSFVAKVSKLDDNGNLIKDETEPKRYTYVFGNPKETYRTAVDRFVSLSNKPLHLDDIREAFSVEALNKEFFDRYKEIYKELYTYLIKETKYRKQLINKKEEDIVKQEKPIRDFIKLLMGRLVFLNFLQKKNWMGVPVKEQKWDNGDLRFMYHLFENCPDKNTFYSKYLRELFYNTLNNPNRKDLIFTIDGNEFPLGKEFGKVKVPYLNGGLFDRDQTSDLDIDFPEYLLKNLIYFFDQYNFTIDENDPYEYEIGIDPEMLGHIFENLLEDNRDKGAFYTPKEIVHYMCKESLIEYLKTYILSETTQNYNGSIPDATRAIENFIRFGDKGDEKNKNNFISKYAPQISEALDNVKVCDPAIGSGAFPMGILQEIFNAKMALNLSQDRATVKKNIIQRSIYGVDLENGAVDIARLRFWLSLVVEEDIPQPLPNLDYKIMQGNSMLERFDDIDLKNLVTADEEDFKASTELDFGDEFKKAEQGMLSFNKAEKDKLYVLIDKYFDTDKWESETGLKVDKNDIKRDIGKIVDDKIHVHVLNVKRQLKKEIKSLENKWKKVVGEDFKKLNQKSKEFKHYIELKKKLEHLDDVENRLHEQQKSNSKQYFLWHLFFKDVFDKGGFDIVIGNPPYIQLQKMGKDCDALDQAGYATFTRTGDIYCLFYELGNSILKKNGVLAYITSNTWMRTKFGELLRNYFATKTNPVQLINFEDARIFQTATVETNIILFKNEPYNGNLKAVAVKEDYRIGKPLLDYLNTKQIILNELPNEGWIILEKQDFTIKSEIENNGIKLKDWDVEFYRGFLTGFNDAFFLTREQKDDILKNEPHASAIIKPLLRGRNIRKFGYEFDELYVLFIPWHFPLVDDDSITGASLVAEKEFKKQFPYTFAHLSNFKEDLANRNKSETGIRYEWYALQRAAATYVKEFEKEKLVWLSISDKPAFALDTDKMYVTAPAYILASHNGFNRYLLTLLNSKVMEWYLDKVSSSTGQGTNQWSKIFVEQLPIPIITDETLKNNIDTLADYLTFLNINGNPKINEFTENLKASMIFEDIANMIAYELYFKSEMVSNDIDIIKHLSFKSIKEIQDKNKIAKIIGETYVNLQATANPIRNKIIQANIRSSVIKRINSTTH